MSNGLKNERLSYMLFMRNTFQFLLKFGKIYYANIKPKKAGVVVNIRLNKLWRRILADIKGHFSLIRRSIHQDQMELSVKQDDRVNFSINSKTKSIFKHKTLG